ncbi:MAG: DUF3782 domain-containing protein [Candidatus Korarchaeum sp.]|jgi:hypothetical protein|nr:DUF3782 domain-containing protein [Candidatus Korarchaeum sp.]
MALSAEEKRKFLRSLDEDIEFRYAVAGYLGISEILKRLDSLEENMLKLWEEVRSLREGQNKLWEEVKSLREGQNKLREEFEKLSMRVEVTMGSMGRRWGEDLERMVLEIFKEALEKRGIEPGKVEKLRFVDRDGSITGIKGKVVDIDISVKDDKLYLIEVKSRAELDHIDALYMKARAAEKYLNRSADKIILVSVNVDREAYDRAEELGIEVICGHVIE